MAAAALHSIVLRLAALPVVALLVGCSSAAMADGIRPPLGTGHGFFVDGNGHILTSRHIVQNCPSIQVSSPTLEAQYATVVAMPDRWPVDLALLKTETVAANVMAFHDTWPKQSPPAGWVVQIAKPIRSTLMAYSTDGTTPLTTPLRIVANRHRDTGIKMLVLQGNVVPGQSGSPVTDDEGRVIGVAFAQLKADNPLKAMMQNQPGGYAMAAREAIDFLAAHGVTATTAPVSKPEGERADALVRVLCQPNPAPLYLSSQAHPS